MASKGKKAVSQEELRRLMKEKQRAAERQRRVQSPFAKYTSAGRLMCALCGEQMKSEAVWQAHVLGRGHKERVGRLKEGQEQGQKRKKEEEEEQQGAGKRAKEERKKEQEGAGKEDKSQKGLPAGFFQSKGAAGLGLLAGQYGDDDDDEEEAAKEEQGKGDNNANAGPKPPGGAAGLPADFFESAVPGGTSSKTTGEEEEQVEEEEEEKGKGAKPEVQLPEGFFDDPVRDARVRNVDTPREQMDREWEEFQKEMRLVNSASDAIVAEDDEEGRIERQIDEIDEQIECFRRVELLRAKQEAAQVRTAKQRAAAEEENREASENDEEDEEELLHVLSRDWRAKGALA
ncbi:hypothetical protein MHYP_G00013780 [Metynnis hypsauchen]